MNPKAKLSITILLLLGCGLTRNPLIIIILFIPFILGFVLLSDKKIFIKRISLFLPFVLATFVFQLFTPGRIIFQGITYEGLYQGSILGAKLLLAIGYSLVFTLSTPPAKIGEALDWITLNKLGLGRTLLVALKFVDLIKKSRKRPFASTLRYAIENSKDFADSLEKYEPHRPQSL